MRRFIGNNLAIVALGLMAITLITGVTWAATSPASNSSTSSDDHLVASIVEIQAIPVTVEVGGQLQVAGAGFGPEELVLFSIIQGDGKPNIILQGGFANSAGAFLVDTTMAFPSGGLPEALTPGIYTIRAATLDGPVASAPLVIMEPKTE